MNINRIFLSLILAASSTLFSFAANTTTTVSQVSSSVTVSNDVDYVITSTTPFTGSGRVNITNIEHAVVIIKNIRPSKVISSWLKYVAINGVQAVNGTNCQVKMYASGAIIMPYAKDFKPLTVYSGQNFQGTAVNDFGLENTGGFMNTLTDAKLNNKIRSFKLKRGYMVTFSTRKEGRGYSRCFIADKEDLEFASLPPILDQSISSYRVFQWYNAKKAGIASDTRAAAISATNSSWCYTWGTGESRLPDAECVPNHIYEDWPSASACGSVTYSCHMKTNNEPGNSSDDHPQSVKEVLDNWENLMRTGMRLCSESSHDGSMSHLKAFMDSIDARGWRCDVVDLHCYWPAGTFNNLNWYSDNYGNGRPIWISEWVWGASWNRNGFWGATSDPGNCSASNQQICYDGTKPILEVLNGNSRVERYAYWNSEAAGTHIYEGTSLTKLGEYYATMDEQLGYNPANEFIPKNPRQYNPSDLRTSYDKQLRKVVLNWHERNGEYNKSMVVECMESAATGWKQVKEVALQEDEADYELTIDGKVGNKYRIKIIDANSTVRYTNIAQTVSDSVEAGDEISVAGETYYMGGNMLINGDFELGFADWTNGKGETLSQPYYEIVPVGGINGSAYLQAYGNNDDKSSDQSIRKVIELEKDNCYYAQLASCNGNDKTQKIATSTSVNFELNTRASASATSEWSKQGSGFKVTADNILLIQLRALEGKAQFDDVIVAKLFKTKAEANADALLWTKKRAEAFKAYNTDYPLFNKKIDQLIASNASALEIEDAIKNSLSAMKIMKYVPALLDEASWAVTDLNIADAEDFDSSVKILNAAVNGTYSGSAADIYNAYEELSGKLQELIPCVINTTSIKNGSFEAVDGWNTKQGSFTGGDQRTATQAGKKCWNAWWSVAADGGESTTMAINQNLSKLDHGFYALEAKATTQHYCVTDQHAFMVVNDNTYNTPSLGYGVLDIPTFSDSEKWQTLVSPYVYLNEQDAVTIGFTGSKKGAIDNAYRVYGNPSSAGDKREGWWCATDFQFRFIPAYKDETDASKWGTVCLPYTITPSAGVDIYEVVGITSDSRIAIRKVDATEGGAPYLYHSSASKVIFFESGEKAKSAKTNVNGLRGQFVNTYQYPLDALVLINGVWTRVTERSKVKDFSAYIQKVSNLPVLESWDGEFLPTDTYVNGVKNAEVNGNSRSQSAYTISGTRARKNEKGIVVVKGKKYVKR